MDKVDKWVEGNCKEAYSLMKIAEKGNVHHSVSTGRIPNILEEVEIAEEVWKGWWNREGCKDVQECLRQYESPLVGVPFSVQMLRESGRSFKKNTASIDEWHIRSLAEMPEAGLRCLSMLWQISEAAGEWPEWEQMAITYLIPKQSGEGTRPVTVFRSLFIWYGKLLAKEAGVWAAQHAGHQVNNLKGRETLDATYREQARAEARKRLGIMSVEVGKDVKKAFEQVFRWILVQHGIGRKYPRRALWMSLMSYTWKRRMCLQGVFGRKIGSNIGIVAGSPFAVQELTLIMCKGVEYWKQMNPMGMHFNSRGRYRHLNVGQIC